MSVIVTFIVEMTNGIFRSHAEYSLIGAFICKAELIRGQFVRDIHVFNKTQIVCFSRLNFVLDGGQVVSLGHSHAAPIAVSAKAWFTFAKCAQA